MISDKFWPLCWHLPRPSKSKYKGSYPLHLEKKLAEFIGYDVEKHKLLHVFAGKSRLGITLDINPELNTDFVADAHNLDMFNDNQFDIVLADPPYSDLYAKTLYGTPKLKPTQYIQEMVRVCKNNGLVILYHLHPIPRPRNTKYLGLITVVTRVYHAPRVISFFKKDLEEI